MRGGVSAHRRVTIVRTASRSSGEYNASPWRVVSSMPTTMGASSVECQTMNSGRIAPDLVVGIWVGVTRASSCSRWPSQRVRQPRRVALRRRSRIQRPLRRSVTHTRRGRSRFIRGPSAALTAPRPLPNHGAGSRRCPPIAAGTGGLVNLHPPRTRNQYGPELAAAIWVASPRRGASVTFAPVRCSVLRW